MFNNERTGSSRTHLDGANEDSNASNLVPLTFQQIPQKVGAETKRCLRPSNGTLEHIIEDKVSLDDIELGTKKLSGC